MQQAEPCSSTTVSLFFCTHHFLKRVQKNKETVVTIGNPLLQQTYMCRFAWQGRCNTSTEKRSCSFCSFTPLQRICPEY